jgi:hypothetical protein
MANMVNLASRREQESSACTTIHARTLQPFFYLSFSHSMDIKWSQKYYLPGVGRACIARRARLRNGSRSSDPAPIWALATAAAAATAAVAAALKSAFAGLSD